MEVDQNLTADNQDNEITNEPTNKMISEDISEVEKDPIHDIIDYLVRDTDACFKSQQIGEKDLSNEEKRTIALDLYKRGKSKFLMKFGKYLKLEHLLYFEKSVESASGDYELIFLISQLKVILNEDSKKIVIKNRRFDAMSKMIRESSYFSEVEMMQRNPLLYEQLVGQYLSEKEKKSRDNIDTDNITFLNVLMEGIQRNQFKSTLKDQKEKEDCQMEENSSSEDDSVDISDEDEENCISSTKWGEYEAMDSEKPKRKKLKKIIDQSVPYVTSTERALFREEFVQEMYRSFLAGEDEEFDYCAVDDNVNYDCIEVRGEDEEEKYFDSETPEELPSVDNEPVEDKIRKLSVKNEVFQNTNPQEEPLEKDESEDELDIYMEHLSKHPAVRELSQI